MPNGDNMHGLGSNAFEQEIYTDFDSVADTAGIIVAYPNGIDETWNISSITGTDDVGFISALIDTINLQYSIDLNRVFATGMSMGGFMSYRLACELSGKIAAIASVAGLQAFYPCNRGSVRFPYCNFMAPWILGPICGCTFYHS